MTQSVPNPAYSAAVGALLGVSSQGTSSLGINDFAGASNDALANATSQGNDSVGMPQGNQGDPGPADITVTAARFYPGISSWPQGSGNFVQVSQRTGDFWDFERDPDSPYYATPAFLARFQGSPEEVAVTATMVTIQAGSYPLYKTLNGADIQLPGGASVYYDIYKVGLPEAPIPSARIANAPGSNIFYYSPYHYKPGPGVPNAYVQFTLYPH